jgi:hypothetical protein
MSLSHGVRELLIKRHREPRDRTLRSRRRLQQPDGAGGSNRGARRDGDGGPRRNRGTRRCLGSWRIVERSRPIEDVAHGRHVADACATVALQAVDDQRANGSRKSGSVRSTAASVSATSSPSNARRPDSISYRTQPNAHTSLRLSAARPFACSGLM